MIVGRRGNRRRSYKDGNCGYTESEQSIIASRAVWGYLTEHAAASSAIQCEPYPYQLVEERIDDILVLHEAGRTFEITPERAPWYVGHIAQYVAHQVLARRERAESVFPQYYDPRDPPLYEFGVEYCKRELMLVPRESRPEFHFLHNVSQVPVSLIAELHAVDALPDFLLFVDLQLEAREGKLLGWLDPGDLLHREPKETSGDDVWLVNDMELKPLGTMPCDSK